VVVCEVVSLPGGMVGFSVCGWGTGLAVEAFVVRGGGGPMLEVVAGGLGCFSESDLLEVGMGVCWVSLLSEELCGWLISGVEVGS
jgi:hypothetical protein